jgi:hypothetical protein
LSGDAQIYSFKIAAKPYTAIDTVNYPALLTTGFAINQFSKLIYNPDSLPYRTTLKKCAVTLGYASSGIGKVELIYPKDSIVDWNTSDSIDFSTYLYPKFRITPLNGKDPKEYTVKILVHQEDPDTLIWKEKTVTNYPASFNKQKTILVGDSIFYTFTTGADNKVYLSKAKKPERTETPLVYETKQAVSKLNASTLILESVTFFNGKFYAVDDSKQGYAADSDGIAWSDDGISGNLTNIAGALPTTDVTTDSLLVITEKEGKYYFAKTSDLKKLVFRTEEQYEVSMDFPLSEYSSATNFDRNNLNNCILAITGGKNTSGFYNNLTWSIKTTSDNVLQIARNQANNVFAAKSGISTFLYDKYLYALTGNKLYKTASYGYKWGAAPNKEILDAGIPEASGQSVITDSKNHIWIFGGIPDAGTAPIQKVWTGRINRLRPKL